MLWNTFNVLSWNCFDIFLSFISEHWSQKFHFDEQRPLVGCFTLLSQERGFRHLLDVASEVEEPDFLAGAGDRAGRRQSWIGGTCSVQFIVCIVCFFGGFVPLASLGGNIICKHFVADSPTTSQKQTYFVLKTHIYVESFNFKHTHRVIGKHTHSYIEKTRTNTQQRCSFLVKHIHAGLLGNTQKINTTNTEQRRCSFWCNKSTATNLSTILLSLPLMFIFI